MYLCIFVIYIYLYRFHKVHDLSQHDAMLKLVVHFVVYRRQNSVSSGIYDSRVSEGHYDVIKPKVR